MGSGRRDQRPGRARRRDERFPRVARPASAIAEGRDAADRRPGDFGVTPRRHLLGIFHCIDIRPQPRVIDTGSS